MAVESFEQVGEVAGGELPLECYELPSMMPARRQGGASEPTMPTQLPRMEEVLGGAGIGVPGEDLGVAQRDAGVEGVGDRRVPQRVGADVP